MIINTHYINEDEASRLINFLLCKTVNTNPKKYIIILFLPRLGALLIKV